eukprot:scaffold17311_cov16-Tisochrysis_lutea.AAC.1
MEATSAEMLAPGAAPSITEESTSTLVIPAAANGSNGAGSAPSHAPKPPLANRPRPPAILLYPPAHQQPTQTTPNQEAGQSLHLSPSAAAPKMVPDLLLGCASLLWLPGADIRLPPCLCEGAGQHGNRNVQMDGCAP